MTIAMVTFNVALKGRKCMVTWFNTVIIINKIITVHRVQPLLAHTMSNYFNKFHDS